MFFDQDGGPVTKKALLQSFGDEKLESGEMVREAFSIVPSDARTALVKAGLDTVGAFMAKDPNELGAALSTGES